MFLYPQPLGSTSAAAPDDLASIVDPKGGGDGPGNHDRRVEAIGQQKAKRVPIGICVESDDLIVAVDACGLGLPTVRHIHRGKGPVGEEKAPLARGAGGHAHDH
jgi:hypothetical protein